MHIQQAFKNNITVKITSYPGIPKVIYHNDSYVLVFGKGK